MTVSIDKNNKMIACSLLGASSDAVFAQRDLNHGGDCAHAVTDGCVDAASPASWR